MKNRFKNYIAITLSIFMCIGLVPAANVMADNASDGWAKSGNNWVYYKNGTVATGWLWDGAWYYLGDTGAMATGWQQINGTWYFFSAGGKMATGWVQSGTSWYYMNPSGAMLTGWQQINGKWYFFNAGGKMAANQWVQSGSSWYYMTASGAMATGWQQINGKWYFFNDNGKMATGWVKSGSSWYYMNTSGAMACSQWVQSGSSWYYMNESGKMVTGEYTIEGRVSTFSESGIWLGYKEEEQEEYEGEYVSKGNITAVKTDFITVDLSQFTYDGTTVVYSETVNNHSKYTLLDLDENVFSANKTTTVSDISCDFETYEGTDLLKSVEVWIICFYQHNTFQHCYCHGYVTFDRTGNITGFDCIDLEVDTEMAEYRSDFEDLVLVDDDNVKITMDNIFVSNGYLDGKYTIVNQSGSDRLITPSRSYDDYTNGKVVHSDFEKTLTNGESSELDFRYYTRDSENGTVELCVYVFDPNDSYSDGKDELGTYIRVRGKCYDIKIVYADGEVTSSYTVEDDSQSSAIIPW